MKRELLLVGIAVILVVTGITALQLSDDEDENPVNDTRPPSDSPDNITADRSNHSETIAEDLDVPWGIEFLPDEDILVTERPGTLVRIERETNTFTETHEIEGVAHRGEGGLLGIAKHPNYTENNQVYLYMTTQVEDGLQNRVVRYQLEDDQLSNPEVIVDELPGAQYHDGGQLEFGPDGKLYITAGDATSPEWAQETDVLAGKVLRLNPDGSIPEDNPFGNEVYSYGHRNPQGLAWIGDQLWATEHGDQRHDELNKIEAGENYGWPAIEANQGQEGMQRPEIHADDTTWAPAGAAYVNGSIFFAGLRGQTLYEAEIEDGEVIDLEEHWENEHGRLRAVEIGPEGYLYVSTSNRDGRGNPDLDDDKIIRVNPDDLT